MNPSRVGLLIVALGIVIVLIGLGVWSGALSWFGKLPGDIRIERETVRVYIPIASMVILSMLLSLILYLINRLF
jgi:hypothetical protein